MKTFTGFTIGIVALATASCATTPAQSPAVNVSGDWLGTWTCDHLSDGSGMVAVKMSQSGAKATGSANISSSSGGINRSGAVEGLVSGDTFATTSWPDLSGSFTVAGDRMTGPFKGVNCSGKIALTREPWKGTGETSRLTTIVGTVEAIDQASRMATFRGSKGNVVTVQIDERVVNLPQVGDTVTVAYYESWALQLDKPGEAAGATTMRTGPSSQTPSGLAARRTNIQATVTAIDAGKPSVTFRGPKGNSQEVNVGENPKILARLKVGDTYDVTYTESLAVAIEKAPK